MDQTKPIEVRILTGAAGATLGEIDAVILVDVGDGSLETATAIGILWRLVVTGSLLASACLTDELGGTIGFALMAGTFSSTFSLTCVGFVLPLDERDLERSIGGIDLDIST